MPVTSLEDLVAYTTGQQGAIEQVLATEGVGFPKWFKPAHGGWIAFREDFWGHGLNKFDTVEHEFTRGDDPIEDLLIQPQDSPDTDVSPPSPTYRLVPNSRRVMEVPKPPTDAWDLECNRILIRSEYEEAEKEALAVLEGKLRVFVVTGQPGIGKTNFLFRLLVRRLLLGLPTALQIRANSALLFHSGGVHTFEDLSGGGPYGILNWNTSDHRSKIWALIDSNVGVIRPSDLFVTKKTFFVVEAASPRQDRIGWTHKVGRELFYMKPWTFPEIAQARTLIEPTNPPGERDLWPLYKDYGASPRLMFEYARRPGAYVRLVRSTVDALEDIVGALKGRSIIKHSHLVVLVEPSPDDRFTPQASIVTQPIFEILWKRHLAAKASLAEEFYSLFTATLFTSAAAGWVFESRMHQLLTEGRTIEVFRVRNHPGRTTFMYDGYEATDRRGPSNHFKLPRSEEHPLRKKCTIEAGRYYRPETTTFTAIDSVFLLEPGDGGPHVLLVFQITHNKSKHDAKLDGLCDVDELILPSGTVKYYIAITPEELQPKITVPTTYLSADRLGGREADDVFPVYHYPVSRVGLFQSPGEK